MKDSEFLDIVDHFHKMCVSVLKAKGLEYGATEHRLIQFYEMANLEHRSPMECLVSQASKHFTSISTMAKLPRGFPRTLWLEKFGDLANYCALGVALATELLGEQNDSSEEPAQVG